MKFLTLAIIGLAAIAAQAYEITLDETNKMIVAKSGIVTAQTRNTNEVIVAGDIRKIGNVFAIAQVDGVTGLELQSNTVVNADTTKLEVSGTLVNTATGVYYKVSENLFTNEAYTVWNLGGTFRITAKANAYKATTNSWYNDALIGNYTNNTGVTGVADIAYPVSTSYVYSVAQPVLSNGLTVDGTVIWLKAPESRKALIVDVVSGDAVLKNAKGDKLFADIKLEDFTQALYGSSTNSAVLEIFEY